MSKRFKHQAPYQLTPTALLVLTLPTALTACSDSEDTSELVNTLDETTDTPELTEIVDTANTPELTETVDTGETPATVVVESAVAVGTPSSSAGVLCDFMNITFAATVQT